MTDEKIIRIRELEEKLSYLIEKEMPVRQKLCILAEALWQAQDDDYCGHMANRILGETESEETRKWEKNCCNKKGICELMELLKERESLY